jgi:phage tail-like protein
MFRNIGLVAGLAACVAATVWVSPDPGSGARAAEFPVNPQRLDPYKNFKFRVKWDGKFVAGISSVSPLVRHTQVIEHREGGDPSISGKSTGLTTFDAITLERGLTQDTAFEDWANLVWRYGAGLGSEQALGNYRKDVIIDVYNEAGQLVTAYNLYRCWPSEYQALSQLDANVAGVAVQKLVLQCDGWTRDPSVVEPKEPTG